MIRGHSRSSAMSPFDTGHTTSYSTLIETMHRFRDFPILTPPHLHLASQQGVTPVEFRGDLWHQKKLDSLNYRVVLFL